jgi:hypothetical protein
LSIEFGGDADVPFNRATLPTKDDARPVLEFLSAGFTVTWFQERSPRLWLALIKPQPNISDYFSLGMEYLLIGHGFPNDFQQRTLLAEPPSDIAFRVDPRVRFVSSNAPMMRAACAAWAVQNRQAIVPIDRIVQRTDADATAELYELLSQSLWHRDVFDDSEPVTDPSEFFGRELVVQELVSRAYLGQLSAIFGLRKVGKSSLLRRVKELLDADSLTFSVTALVLCNATRIKSGRWSVILGDLLHAWADGLNRRARRLDLKTEVREGKLATLLQPGKPAPTDAQLADAFQKDFQKLLKAAGSVAAAAGASDIRLIALFDEADELYPHRTDSGYWRDDYFALWNTLQTIKRGLDIPSQLVYMLGGVNPSGVESGALLSRPNPLFELSTIYLKPLTLAEARSLMVGIGTRVGLSFEEGALTAAYEISGGHPWLLRKLGSQVHRSEQSSPSKRVISESVVRRVFERTKRTFYQHVEWILQHLRTVAPDEYRLLRDIAVGGKDRYLSEWKDERFRETFAEHLFQYGIVSLTNDVPSISVGLIRDAFSQPTPTDLSEQKARLREAGEDLEASIRLRITSDVARDRTVEEAVSFIVEAIPKEAKNRPKTRQELRELGLSAGLRALVDALNWGDYLLVLSHEKSGVTWSGKPLTTTERVALLEETVKMIHLARHNNDSELQQVFQTVGFDGAMRKINAAQEMLGS